MLSLLGRVQGNRADIYGFPVSTLVLMDYAKGKKVSNLSRGMFKIQLLTQGTCGIFATVCSVGDFMWPLTKDTFVVRVSIRTFAIALPGLLLGFQVRISCPILTMDSAKIQFQKYAHFKDLYDPQRGYPVDDDDPNLWKRIRLLFAPMAHEALRELGHVPGVSRFSVENHNSCTLRACRLSAIAKLIAESMFEDTIKTSFINITGTNPPAEANQGRAFATMSTYTGLVDAAEYASLVSHGLSPKGEGAEAPLRLASPDIGYKVWNLNQDGLLVFMHRLESATELEERNLSETREKKVAPRKPVSEIRRVFGLL